MTTNEVGGGHPLLFETAVAVLDLGALSLDFGKVQRGTFHQDGTTYETDTTHTVMLGLVACSLATRIGGLDVGKVAQLALAHDLPEVYAGDTRTLKLPTAAERKAKKQREEESTARITSRFLGRLSWLPLNIAQYEARHTAEARFVWGVDKILPKLTHIQNGCAAAVEQGVTADQLEERYSIQRIEMVGYCSDWPLLLELYDLFVAKEIAVLRAVETSMAPSTT